MELEREALLVYLSNLRILETIIYENDEVADNILSKKKQLKTELEKTIECKPLEPEELDEKHDKIQIINGILIAISSFSMGINSYFTDKINAIAVIFICWGVFDLFMCIMIKKITVQEMEEYQREMEEYQRKMEEYNERIQRESERKKEKDVDLNKASTMIDEEKRSLKKILNDAYDLNIIPLQFRNIEGVYYLYDYLSTSNESLTSALMQENLESIKNKLDQIISLQGAMIIQQAKANRALFEQNEKILKTMKNVEQYSKISAINSEVSVKLSAKQLAYQQAEFLLK